jgi:hypothetical protein
LIGYFALQNKELLEFIFDAAIAFALRRVHFTAKRNPPRRARRDAAPGASGGSYGDRTA